MATSTILGLEDMGFTEMKFLKAVRFLKEPFALSLLAYKVCYCDWLRLYLVFSVLFSNSKTFDVRPEQTGRYPSTFSTILLSLEIYLNMSRLQDCREECQWPH